MPIIADEIYKMLVKYTGSIYGNPGTTELPFLRYIPENVNYYLALHDGIAVGMSEGYYLKTGKLGVSNLHAGPGLSNSFGYIYSAYHNKSPLLIIVGQQASHTFVDEPMLYYNFHSLPSVKDYIVIKNSKEVIKSLNRAIRTCLSPPYGPVIVSLPYDIIDIESHEKSIDQGEIKYSNLCDDTNVKEIAERINSSYQVAIIAGYEIDVYEAWEELRTLSEKLKSPIYTEPYLSRSVGVKITDTLPTRASEINKIIRNYDFVLIVGAELHRILYADEEIEWRKAIQITSDLNEARKRPWSSIVCNVKDFLIKLNSLVKQKNEKSISIIRERKIDEKIYNAMKMLRDNLNGYTVFSEASSHGEITRKMFSEGKHSFYTNRAGLLGWALPAGIGYSSAGGKSLIILGDGSFNYTPQALWTASRYSLDVRILLINNRGYESLRMRAGYDKDFFSPITHPWRVAMAYDFDSREFDDPNNAVKWLMEGNPRKFAELIE